MGDGGLLKQNLLQCLHRAYNLTQQYKSQEWKDMWTLLSGVSLCHEIKSPIMTRWEFVGETTEHVLQYRNEWKIVTEHVVHVEKSGSTRHTIASYLLSYLREKMIMAHLYFLRSYIKCWWGKHFTWLKHVDPQTKTPGFLAAHIAVHYYVMHCDLENMINTWKTMDEFAEFRNEFPHDSSSYTADYLASAFFKRAKDRFHKHFKQ